MQNRNPRNNKKERLLNAAAEAFWIKGYNGTSLSNIADNADVPLGNVYYYFKTKKDIALGVAEIFLDETHTSLRKLDMAHRNAPDKIRAFIHMLKESAQSRVLLGCPIARAIGGFHTEAPQAAQKTNEVFKILIHWLSDVLKQAGDTSGANHARNAIIRWQGAIILAHGAQSDDILLECLNELEIDLLIYTQNTKSKAGDPT